MGLPSLIRDLKRPQARTRRGLTLLEGVRLIEDALEAGAEIRGAAVAPALEATERGRGLKTDLATRGIPLEPMSDRALGQLADTEHPQGIVAVVTPPHWTLEQVHPAVGRPVLVLDRVQDPGNVGTMVRSTFALGGAGVIALKGTADVTAPKVLRSSMGAVFRLPVVRATLAEFLEWLEVGTALWLADPAGRALGGIKAAGPVAIVIGNEGAGLDPAFQAITHQRVAVPLATGADSLNAAVTAGILLYEVIHGS